MTPAKQEDNVLCVRRAECRQQQQQNKTATLPTEINHGLYCERNCTCSVIHVVSLVSMNTSLPFYTTNACLFSEIRSLSVFQSKWAMFEMSIKDFVISYQNLVFWRQLIFTFWCLFIAAEIILVQLHLNKKLNSFGLRFTYIDMLHLLSIVQSLYFGVNE